MIIDKSDVLSVTIPNNVGNVIFDGNGRSITYVDSNGDVVTSGRISNGLFNTENNVHYEDITIKNLTIVGGQTSNDGGFICSSNFGDSSTSNILISRCNVSGIISGENSGGIVGSNFGASATGTLDITDCFSTGEISGTGSGGIVGSFYGIDATGTFKIEKCYSLGKIGGTDSGGIVGSHFSRNSSGIMTVEKCYSIGEINGTASGGIVGSYFGDSSTGNLTIKECYSNGEISGVSSGGITGNYFGYNLPTNNTLNIVDVYSTGIVSGEKSGGILGDNFGYNADGAMVYENFYSSGDVSGNTSNGISGENGGVNIGINGQFSFKNIYMASGNYNNIANDTKTAISSKKIDFVQNLDATIWNRSSNNSELPELYFQAESHNIMFLHELFPKTGNSLIDVKTVASTGLHDTTTYTLQKDLIINTDNLSAALIPENVGNVIFDGNNHSVTYVDSNGNETTDLVTNGLFQTSEGLNFLIMIKNISVRGGQLADTCGFICSPFFGKSNSGNGIYIMDCSSTGLISGINSGGIVGGAFGMEASCSLIISNCYSSGNITSANSGGIAGAYCGSALVGSISIIDCYSNGSIQSENSGGIVGSYCGEKIVQSATLVISRSHSSGDISASGAGGITGSNFGDNSSQGCILLVNNCYSEGIINASDSGGIMGVIVQVIHPVLCL